MWTIFQHKQKRFKCTNRQKAREYRAGKNRGQCFPFSLHPTLTGSSKLNHLWSFHSALVRERAEMRQTSRACWWERSDMPGIWVLVPHVQLQKSSHSQVVECRWNLFIKSEKNVILSTLMRKWSSVLPTYIVIPSLMWFSLPILIIWH